MFPMDNKLLLCKAATLLYRESQLSEKTENSSDLIRTVLESIQISDIGIGVNSDREVTMALKSTILEMCNYPLDHVYDKTDILQRFRVNCGNDEKLYEAIKQGIEDEIQESSLKRSVINMRKAINNHFRENNINDVLMKASANFKFNRDKIKSIDTFIGELIGQLEPLQMTIGAKDSAVIDDLDIGNTELLRVMFDNVKELNAGQRVYKVGWPAVNDMLQGGFRPGETWVFGGLQHKYKTGFNLSVVAQIARFNKPLTTDPNKKPLILYISTEDSLLNSLQFLYQFLTYSERREYVNIMNVSTDEMIQCIRERLQETGFHFKMIRIDPNQWTYKNVCNKVIELEAQGYSVEVLDIDYLYKIPKTGCETGTLGHDVMDQLSRVRAFCSAKGILFLTPHQLSTAAKALLRGGLPEDQFVKEIAGRGFFEGTSALDRIYDGCILIHLFKFNKETYFTLMLDKHRLPTVIDEDMKYLIFKFPKGMPIPYSINGEDESFKKMKSAASNADESLFQLG